MTNITLKVKVTSFKLVQNMINKQFKYKGKFPNISMQNKHFASLKANLPLKVKAKVTSFRNNPIPLDD